MRPAAKPSTRVTIWSQGFREAVADSESSYLLGYYLEPNATPGWHKLQVEVTRPGAHIRARAGFLVPKENAAQRDWLQRTPSRRHAPGAGSKPGDDFADELYRHSHHGEVAQRREGESCRATGPDAGKMAVPFQIILPPEAVRLASDESTISLSIVGLARTSHGEDAANFVKKIDGKLKPETAKRLVLAGIKFDSSCCFRRDTTTCALLSAITSRDSSARLLRR